MGAHAVTRPFRLTDPAPFEAAAGTCADHVHAATWKQVQVRGL